MDIIIELNKHAHKAEEYARERNNIPFITLLQGSQNYNLDDENSDIDTKTIVVPTWRKMVLDKQPLSTTLEMPDSSHVDIKDAREMIACYKKQNINFVETLFTDYGNLSYKINVYTDLWNELLRHREDIAHYNRYAAVQCVRGQAYNKYRGFSHPSEGNKKIFEEYGYMPKELHHLHRNLIFLKKYLNDMPYKECLVCSEKEREILMHFKRDKLPFEQAEKSREWAFKQIDTICDNYCLTHKNEFNKQTNDFLNDWLYRLFKTVNEKQGERQYACWRYDN